MTALTFSPGGSDGARPLYLVSKDNLSDWLETLPDADRNWIEATCFKAAVGEVLLIPGPDGVKSALGGLGGATDRARKRFVAASVRSKLPAGDWVFDCGLSGDDLSEAALGWLLAGYRFERYASAPAPEAMLSAPKDVDAARLERIAKGEALARDLINTPASDMGPDELEAAARALAGQYGARVVVTIGDDLLDANHPMIHAVGRASPRAPRLIDMRWGETWTKYHPGRQRCLF